MLVSLGWLFGLWVGGVLVSGQSSNNGCPTKPRVSMNTTSGISTSIESGDDDPLQYYNCTWTLSINDDGGYFELLDSDSVTMWTSYTLQSSKQTKSSESPYELELTVAGNLRFSDSESDILWESDTANTDAGDRPYKLEMQSNGNVILSDTDDDEIWSLYCEDTKPFMSSNEELRDGEEIYASTCVYVLMLEYYTLEMRYYYEWEDTQTTPNGNYKSLFSYPSESVNITGLIEPFVLSIDDDGTLGVKDASNTYLWQVSNKIKSAGAAPYFLRVEDDGTISVYDSLNILIWDSSIEGLGSDPQTELFEILVFSLYYGIFFIYFFGLLFKIAYLTRNRKEYTRDSESGAMHYTKRSEIRAKLAESMTLGGDTPGGVTAGGPTRGGGSKKKKKKGGKKAVDELLLGPKGDNEDNEEDEKKRDSDNEDNDDSIKTSGDEAESKDDLKEMDKGDKKDLLRKKHDSTRARLDATQESQRGFKFLSMDHFRRWHLIMKLFADMIFVCLIHFLCNATSYAILIRWFLANFGGSSFEWCPSNISVSEFQICFYILVSILVFYHFNSAFSLRINYRNTFYGLANKMEVTYIEERTMRNVFYQQLGDIRIIREIRSSTFNEQASQFLPDIAKTKYAVCCVPQSILFLYFIMRVEDYSQSWLVIFGLCCNLLYMLVNNIQTDDEVFSQKASQKWPPTPGFLARILFRSFEIIGRVSIFALAAVAVHWTGVIILVCYHLIVNFLFFQGSLLGKDPWNIVYFILTIADLGLISRRRELDSWVSKFIKLIVHAARGMTCFLFTSSIDSILHCVRLDEQLLFDFIFGRFIESMVELCVIYYFVALNSNDGSYLPQTDQDGTLLFLAFVCSLSFLMFFFILRFAKQFDHNQSKHRNALELARDGRWSMLSDYIPFYSEQEINKCDRFGDRTTILIYACEERQTKIVMQLLDRECDTSLTDRHGNTALHKAAKNGRIDILDALIAANANVNVCNNKGWTPLHVACKERHNECVTKLVEANAAPLAVMNENLTCIGVAMRFGSIEIVKYLLETIKVTHYKDEQIEEAMNYVSTCEDFGGPLVHALHYGESKLGKILLECRVQSVDAQDHFGETSLHKACSWGYYKIAKELIETYDCDVNIISDKGYSPFHIAVARQFPRIVDLLVEEDANIDFPTISFAEKVLLKTCVTGHYNIFKHVMKEEKKLNLDVRDLDGNSSLLLAAQNKNVKIARNLIKSGCDVTLRNMWGKSIFDTKLPDNLREAVEYVLKVQSGLIAMHGDPALGVTPGMEMVTPGLEDDDDDDYGKKKKRKDDDEPGIMGLDSGNFKKVDNDDNDVLVPESQGQLGWGPGGGPGGGPAQF